jgi:hypothetical protein
VDARVRYEGVVRAMPELAELEARRPARDRRDRREAATGLQAVTETISDSLAERAHDLLDRNAIALVVGYEDRAAVVNGDHGWYVIRCTRDGVTCDCQAGASGSQCAHVLAAMMVWSDALSDPFSGVRAAENATWSPRQEVSR